MTTSAELFDLASRHIPGGVNSPVRAFKGLHRPPVFMERAQGAYLFDVEGNRYCIRPTPLASGNGRGCRKYFMVPAVRSRQP